MRCKFRVCHDTLEFVSVPGFPSAIHVLALTHCRCSDELLELLAASYPVPRLGTAPEVADLICFAAFEGAGYITGASLDINGGDLMM